MFIITFFTKKQILNKKLISQINVKIPKTVKTKNNRKENIQSKALKKNQHLAL